MTGANTATDLLAIRIFSPFTTYAVGNFVLQGGFIYRCILPVATLGAFTPANWEQVKMASDPPIGGPYVRIAGDVMTGRLTAPDYVSNGAAGAVRGLYGETAGSARWLLALGDATAEGGANAGSNFQLNAFTDVGGALLTALAIERATGRLTIVNDLSISRAAGNTRSVLGRTGANARWEMQLGGPTPETGANAGSNFNLLRYDDTGVLIPGASPLSINRATGVATLTNVSAPQAIGDNRVINGNFAVNQRSYVSGTALPANPTVANGYGHDRWKAGVGGCTYTFVAAVPDTTINITAGTLTQVVEAGMIEGGVYTLSWTGTAQARVYQGAPAGAYAVSPIITAALPAGVNTIVEFNTGSVVRVKLEIGSVATPFNRQSLAKTLADCERYYQRIQIAFYGWGAANQAAYATAYWFVSPRANPTMTIVTPGNVNFLQSAWAVSPTCATLEGVVGGTTGAYVVNVVAAATAEL